MITGQISLFLHAIVVKAEMEMFWTEKTFQMLKTVIFELDFKMTAMCKWD